jgi:hypothetical protein
MHEEAAENADAGLRPALATWWDFSSRELRPPAPP